MKTKREVLLDYFLTIFFVQKILVKAGNIAGKG